MKNLKTSSQLPPSSSPKKKKKGTLTHISENTNLEKRRGT
jgi:hypothetical protein